MHVDYAKLSLPGNRPENQDRVDVIAHNDALLMVDDSFPPASRLLPEWGLRAEFWIDGIGDDYRRDITESGAFLYLSTDQVRFYPIDAPQRLAHASGGGYGRRQRREGLICHDR